MKIIKTIKFDKDEHQTLLDIYSKCCMASYFFSDYVLDGTADSGLKSIRVIAESGHGLEKVNFDRAIEAVGDALTKLSQTRAHPLFPNELKMHSSNLERVKSRLIDWRHLLV